MNRPDGVDKDATWMNDAWHKGNLTKSMKPAGDYKMWDEYGRLTDEGEFDKRGNIMWYKSYYPDGSVGRHVEYDKSTKKTTARYFGYHEYYERIITPLPIGDTGYAEKIYDGKLSADNRELYNGITEGVTFYKDSGDILGTYRVENYTNLIQTYTQKPRNESWQDALKRLDDYWQALKTQLKKDGDEHPDDYYSISCEKNVNEVDLNVAEERLGVSFPESYRNFVLEEGLLTFGTEDPHDNYEQRMLHPEKIYAVEDMLDEDRDGSFASYFQLSKEKRDKVICFFKDQNDIQYEGWAAFDCSSENAPEKNVITGVGCENIYEWEERVGKKTSKTRSSMDVFISTYVDTLIKERNE